MSKSTRRAKAASAAAKLGTVAVLSLGGAAPVQAQQDIERDWQHFVDCVGWLLTDPVQHAANCSPSRVAPFFGSLSTSVAGAPPVVEEEYENDNEGQG